MKKKSLSGGGGETLFEGLPIQGAAQWSRDTAVACCCCCDGADVASTELMLRVARVPPRGAAASLLEVLPEAPGAGTRRVLGCSAAATELRRPSAPSRSLGRDAQNEEAGIHFPPCRFKFQWSRPTVLGHPLAL